MLRKLNNHLKLFKLKNFNQKKSIQIYIDNGTIGLEKRLQPGCDQMLEALRNKGYKEGEDLLWFQAMGAEHNEKSWSERLWRPLQFFFSQ